MNALDALDTDDPFLALNGDILTDLDLTEMLARHRDRGAVATIALTHVEDARPYGLVPMDADGRVLEFREKPSELVPGDINAGTYVLDPAALEGWTRGETVSIERQIFPALIAAGRPARGVPVRRVLDGPRDAAGVPAGALRPARRPGGRRPPVPVAVRDADGADRAVRDVTEHVVVGPRATIETGARVSDSVLHERAVVEADAVVSARSSAPARA